MSIFTVVSLPYQLRQYKCLSFVVSLLLLQFLRALWFALRERVSCLDELDMCTTRLRLQLPGEPATDDIHVIRPLQVQRCILLTIAISYLSHFILVKMQAKTVFLLFYLQLVEQLVGIFYQPSISNYIITQVILAF